MVHPPAPLELAVQYVVDGAGKPISVILSVEDFEELLEQLEDAYDIRMQQEMDPAEEEDAMPWAAFLPELDAEADA